MTILSKTQMETVAKAIRDQFRKRTSTTPTKVEPKYSDRAMKIIAAIENGKFGCVAKRSVRNVAVAITGEEIPPVKEDTLNNGILEPSPQKYDVLYIGETDQKDDEDFMEQTLCVVQTAHKKSTSANCIGTNGIEFDEYVDLEDEKLRYATRAEMNQLLRVWQSFATNHVHCNCHLLLPQ